jgi:hypothetical protein
MVTGSFVLICVFVSIVSVRVLVCCFLEITMAAIADVQLTNGCCLRGCGVERFRLLWRNRVSALLLVRQYTRELISRDIVERPQDWRPSTWEDDGKGVPVVGLLVLLLDSIVVIVCLRPHLCRLHQCHLHHLPISRYVYSHHATLAGRCDLLSGGRFLLEYFIVTDMSVGLTWAPVSKSDACDSISL